MAKSSKRRSISAQRYGFVGGRRRINAARRLRAEARLSEVFEAFCAGESQASIARRYGLHRSSICRQLKAAEERGYGWSRILSPLRDLANGPLGDGFRAVITERLSQALEKAPSKSLTIDRR